MATKVEQSGVDPVTFQVIKASLSGIVQEMQNSLFRTGYSTIIRESQDASCALLNAHGEVVAQHVVVPHALAQQLRAAEDPGQLVVEIVRHSARELPERRHLLGLLQALFHALALGDVDRHVDRGNDLAVLLDRRRAAQQPHRRAVAADVARLVLEPLAALGIT